MASSKKKEEELTGEQALEVALASLEKNFGSGTVVAGDRSSIPKIERISSGSLLLDRALSGGFPRGRLVEIYGLESSGKTTIALHTIAECQRMGGKALLIDAEHALDADYSSTLGVDLDKLLISQPSCGEEGLEVLDILARTGEIQLAVIDSVPAMVPKAELEGKMIDIQPGLQARLMSKACRKLTGVLSKTNTCVIFINQIRMKLTSYGNPETTGGGLGLKFFASQRVEVRRIGWLEGSLGSRTGTEIRAKVVKSKVGPPFRTAELKINFGTGVDIGDDLLKTGLAQGIITRAGAWYSAGEKRLAQGTEAAIQAMLEDEGLVKKIREKELIR